jgi:hypothetical protein
MVSDMVTRTNAIEKWDRNQDNVMHMFKGIEGNGQEIDKNDLFLLFFVSRWYT